MKATARTQMHVGKSTAPLFGTTAILQRKCACGGSTGLDRRCANCQKKKLFGKPRQTQMRINEPGDQYEQEADQVANQVIRMPALKLKAKEPHSARTPLVQRQVAGGDAGLTEAPSIVHDGLSSPGQSLDAATRAFFEPRFGHDFGQVRVHSDTQATESAETVNALAYTVGQNIVFGAGKYAPETTAGKKLLAHELTHVIQQRNADEDRHLQKSPGSDPVPEKEDEPISLGTESSGSHEIVIDGQPYVILVTANPESWGIMYKKFQGDIQAFLNDYPKLGGGIWAFILEKSGARFCPIGGNCLGWARGSFAIHDTNSHVWDKVPEYVESNEWEVSEGSSPLRVYTEKVNAKQILPHAIWDYYMNVVFHAMPAGSEADASLALYGRGFGGPAEGPSHIAFRPRGGNLWLSKPSSIKPPILHQNAIQMSGGQMGEITRYYKREEGAVDHIYMRRSNSKFD